MADRIIQTETLQSIANALRGGSSQSDDDKIQVSDFAEVAQTLKADETALAGLIDGSLTELTIPEGTTKTSDKLCYQYTSLTKVSIAGTVLNIGNESFSGCSNLEEAVIADGVQTIGNAVFSNCDLKEIEIPDSVTSIGYSTFYNNTNLKRVTLSNNLSTISDNMFLSCSELEEIDLPNSLTKLSSTCFKDCSKLKKIYIPSGVTFIGMNAFQNCSSLEEVYLPSSLERINGNWAFPNIKSDAVINCGFSEGAVTGAPWGAPNTVTINYDVNN